MSFDFATCLSGARSLSEQGTPDEDALSYLRAEGASMLDSVKIMRQVKGISLQEAQELVVLSETWKDQREGHESLQDILEEALRNLSQESSR